MVVIEQEQIEKNEKEEAEAIPRAKKSLSNESPPSSSTTAARDGGDNSGYVSDGFETASETELDHYDETVKEEKPEAAGAREGNCQTETVSSATSSDQKADSTEEIVDEKVLEEANNAKLEGNTLFKDGSYEDALSKYDLALNLVPNLPSTGEMRSIFHANRAACFSKLGKFEETIKECSKALDINPKYVKVLLRRGEAHEKLENFEEAIADITKILELDPANDQARRSIIRLKPLADEKREKMKEEMIGKLKEMGNSILGRFGMSVDNFKAVKDPNTGSYSISFQR